MEHIFKQKLKSGAWFVVENDFDTDRLLVDCQIHCNKEDVDFFGYSLNRVRASFREKLEAVASGNASMALVDVRGSSSLRILSNIEKVTSEKAKEVLDWFEQEDEDEEAENKLCEFLHHVADKGGYFDAEPYVESFDYIVDIFNHLECGNCFQYSIVEWKDWDDMEVLEACGGYIGYLSEVVDLMVSCCDYDLTEEDKANIKNQASKF